MVYHCIAFLKTVLPNTKDHAPTSGLGRNALKKHQNRTVIRPHSPQSSQSHGTPHGTHKEKFSPTQRSPFPNPSTHTDTSTESLFLSSVFPRPSTVQPFIRKWPEVKPQPESLVSLKTQVILTFRYVNVNHSESLWLINKQCKVLHVLMLQLVLLAPTPQKLHPHPRSLHGKVKLEQHARPEMWIQEV